MKLLNKIIIFIIISFNLSLASIDVIVSTIDNPYDSTTAIGSWEQNSKYTIQVKLFNNSTSAQSFNRVEANLDFSASQFNFLSRTDRISGWTATNFFVVSNGHVQYQRAANSGEPAISIPAQSSLIIYEITLRVNSSAVLGLSAVNLDQNFTHVLYNISDLTGAKTNLSVTVITDSTPPVTRIQPAANIHLNQATNITLDNDPNSNTNCLDLKEIHYTLDGSNPTLVSPLYTAPFSLPLNSTTVVKWFGLDNNNNSELIRNATYRVDTIKPIITNISTEPITPLRVKKGTAITINFTAYDNIQLTTTEVKIGNNNAQFVTRNNNYYRYSYLVNDNTDGYRTITITATDHAGNTQINNSINLYIDNTPPTFNLDYINPKKANVGTTVVFQFEASEELDLNNSSITIGQNSAVSFMGRSGLHYMFARLIDGTETSGWIRIQANDLAGNSGNNLSGNNSIKISGYDLLNNYGETTTSFNISY